MDCKIIMEKSFEEKNYNPIENHKINEIPSHSEPEDDVKWDAYFQLLKSFNKMLDVFMEITNQDYAYD